MKRDPAIEIARWLAVFAVVFHHEVFITRYSADTIGKILSIKELLAWCVPCFFTISGYLSRVDQPLRSFLTKRLSRLLIPYFAVSSVSFLALYGINAAGLYHVNDQDSLSISVFLRNLFTGKGFGPQLYFLPYLLVVSIGVHALMRHTFVWFGFWFFLSLCVLQACLGFPPGTLGPAYENLSAYALAFSLGSALQIASPSQKRLLLFGVSALGVVFLITTGEAFLVNIAFPMWLYLAIRKVPQLERLDTRIAPYSSGAVYLWHTPILLPMASVVLLKCGIGEMPNAVLAFFAAIFLSLVTHEILVRLRLARYFSL